MCYYTQYNYTFVHTVRIKDVPKQCTRTVVVHSASSEENDVGPDSRQVP